MNTVKRLVLVFSLAIVLAGTAFAGEMNTPPCTYDPGEMNTPPCPSNQMVSDPVDESVTISSTVETLAIETTISAIENLLTVN